MKLQNLSEQVSASEAVETKSKDRGDARASASYNRGQSARSDDRRTSEEQARRQSGYIDIVYAGDRANGSMRRFGNFGVGPGQDRRVYGIEDVMKVSIRVSLRCSLFSFPPNIKSALRILEKYLKIYLWDTQFISACINFNI